MTQRKHKGAVLLGYLDFIRHEWGQGGLDECLASLNLDMAAISPDEYYPLAQGEAILEWISKSKGMEYVKRAGQHTVKNLGSLAHLVKFVNIKHLLKRAKDNYEETFDYGAVSVMSDDIGKRALVIMKNANFIEESNMAWLGAFVGMMEVTRTKGTVKQNKCQIMGDEYDEFLLDWS
jgi:flagellar basal body rod protein FlgG